MPPSVLCVFLSVYLKRLPQRSSVYFYALRGEEKGGLEIVEMKPIGKEKARCGGMNAAGFVELMVIEYIGVLRMVI